MKEDYYLPADTARLVDAQFAACKNLSLILDKYPPVRAVENSKEVGKEAGKGSWLQELVRDEHIDTALAQAAYNRWRMMMAALETTLFDAALDWRMVVGLGGNNVLETDITLHHLYGLPFIPASALKGLTRAYLTGEVKDHESTKIENDDVDVLRIFGSQKQAGTVVFFDAMPAGGQAAFALDIMNPHYPDYYAGGKKPPANDQNPIPVTFLTVTGTTFTFALAPRDPRQEQHRADVEQVQGWLQEALQKYGIGGKTSAGYGLFKGAEPVQVIPPVSTAPGQTSTGPREQIRPKIPQFTAGREITGLVIAPTEELRRIAPEDARALLRYESFSLTEVLIVISAEEAQNWKPGDTRNCVFLREEESHGCSVLMCQPRIKKEKKK